MARKPIHLQAAGKLTPRDRIWAAIRALHRARGPDEDAAHVWLGVGHPGSFVLTDISRQCVKDAPPGTERKRIDANTIESYLRCLVAGGYLRARQPADRFLEVHYELARDVGVHAPRVTKEGRPVEQGAQNACLWTGMRRLKRFDYRELLMAAGRPIAVTTAKHYCHMLRRAGYLAVDVPSKPGTPARYRFVRDTGPKAPMIQRVKHVYDPNLGEVVWHPEVNS